MCWLSNQNIKIHKFTGLFPALKLSLKNELLSRDVTFLFIKVIYLLFSLVLIYMHFGEYFYGKKAMKTS